MPRISSWSVLDMYSGCLQPDSPPTATAAPARMVFQRFMFAPVIGSVREPARLCRGLLPVYRPFAVVNFDGFSVSAGRDGWQCGKASPGGEFRAGRGGRPECGA